MDATRRHPGQRPRIVIVGGGASGLLTARALLADGRAVDVTIVEPNSPLGAGLAFGTRVRAHRLNVPASRMSALPEAPTDFHRWLGDRNGEAFVERTLYADYLLETLANAISKASSVSSFGRRRGTASDLAPGAPWSVRLLDGDEVPADRVVLALGNAKPRDPWDDAVRTALGASYVRDPWTDGALGGLERGAPVILLGTGLTAVDVVLALRESGHRGQIFALSRHGLVPVAHREGGIHLGHATAIDATRARGSVRALLAALRADAARRVAVGEGDGRDAVASLRPHTQSLWKSLDERERRRFLAHARRHWDAFRHRMPPDVARTIGGLRATGALEVRAGRVRGVRSDGREVEVAWVPRGTSIVEFRRAARVINATGPDADYRGAVAPLASALRARGWLIPDPLGLGIRTEDDGALVTSDPSAKGRLFTLGPPRIGDLWETTAIPEIRVQAVALARRLLDLGA